MRCGILAMLDEVLWSRLHVGGGGVQPRARDGHQGQKVVSSLVQSAVLHCVGGLVCAKPHPLPDTPTSYECPDGEFKVQRRGG